MKSLTAPHHDADRAARLELWERRTCGALLIASGACAIALVLNLARDWGFL